MTPLENLDEQIKEIILLNGDIDIEEHPTIIADALELGINRSELSRKASKIFASLDLAPFRRIDKNLEKNILQGSISNKEAEEIIEGAAGELQRPKVINYILGSIKKRGFLPREKNSFEHDSFKNRWMTDEAWAKYQQEKNAVEWLGEKAQSLIEIGEISYRKPEDAKYYLRNTNYLIPNITTLTKSASKADEFSKIIEDEPNLDKRYLKVLYRLDPRLPFLLDNREFTTISKLFEKTATEFHLFVAAAESYKNGHIQIWLEETDAINAEKLTPGQDYNNFLRFVYEINPHHPFYLNSVKYDTPEELFEKAGFDASLWTKISDATKNQQLATWLSGIGRMELVHAYNEYKEKISKYRYYSDSRYRYYSEEEMRLSLVQYLINAVDVKSTAPHIVSDQKEIKLLSIEGNKLVNHNIFLQLINSGYAIAGISLDTDINGISLGSKVFTFWSQNGLNKYTLTLTVDASKLVRNKSYSCNLLINTEFEKLVIPIELKVVFPKKAYLTKMLTYSLFGAAFFALVRYIIGIITENDNWLSIAEPSNPGTGFLPQNYFSYFIGLVFVIGGLIGAIFLIKKIEKI